LFDAYFGSAARIKTIEKRPFASNIALPFGFVPNASATASDQAPTRSFAD
jgi:hypothetical protein